MFPHLLWQARTLKMGAWAMLRLWILLGKSRGVMNEKKAFSKIPYRECISHCDVMHRSREVNRVYKTAAQRC